MSGAPPGFRPLDEFLDEFDAEMLEREGIHWLIRKERARSRLRWSRFWSGLFGAFNIPRQIEDLLLIDLMDRKF